LTTKILAAEMNPIGSSALIAGEAGEINQMPASLPSKMLRARRRLKNSFLFK
jgi:hypothetical protein